MWCFLKTTFCPISIYHFYKESFVPSDIGWEKVDMEHNLHFISYLGLIMSLPCLYLSYFIYVKKNRDPKGQEVHFEQSSSRICKESFFTVQTPTIFLRQRGEYKCCEIIKEDIQTSPPSVFSSLLIKCRRFWIAAKEDKFYQLISLHLDLWGSEWRRSVCQNVFLIPFLTSE